MKKLVVLLAFLALVAALSAFEAAAQVKEGEESEILWKKTPGDFNPDSFYVDAIFTPDESKVLISKKTKLVEVDAASGSFIREIPGIFGAWQFSDDGQYFYTLDRKKIRYSTMEIVGRYSDSITGNWPMTGFSVNEKAGLFIGYILQSSSTPLIDNSIYIYDEKTFQLKKITGIMGHQIYDLQISPNGDYFVTSSNYDPDRYTTGDEKVIFTKWDTKTLQIIDSRDEFATAKKFSPDGKWIAATLFNKVALYDSQTFEKKWENAHEGWDGGALLFIAFSPDSKYVVTASNDGPNYRNPHIWDVEKGKLATKYTEFNSMESMFIEKIQMNRNYNVLTMSNGAVRFLRSKVVSTPIETRKFYDFIYYPEDRKIAINIREQGYKIINVEIFNETGKRITNLNQTLDDQNSVIIDVSNLPSGAYFARIIINNIPYTEKFIKE